jgi:hypothetical protein
LTRFGAISTAIGELQYPSSHEEDALTNDIWSMAWKPGEEACNRGPLSEPFSASRCKQFPGSLRDDLAISVLAGDCKLALPLRTWSPASLG